MYNPWFFWGGRIVGLILVIAVIFLIYKLYRNNDSKNKKDDDLLEMLKMKYIKGEITEEEYSKKKELLKK
jgi:putative membrane protein